MCSDNESCCSYSDEEMLCCNEECENEVEDGDTYCWNCQYVADWKDAFNKWGHDDGGATYQITEYVAEALEKFGYTVERDSWGLHNYVIMSIKKDDVEIYGTDEMETVGYDHDWDIMPKLLGKAMFAFQLAEKEYYENHPLAPKALVEKPLTIDVSISKRNKVLAMLKK